MAEWTFEIQWPDPFVRGWQRSACRFATAEQAAAAMGGYIGVTALNDLTGMEGRLVRVDSPVDATLSANKDLRQSSTTKPAERAP